MNYSNRLLQYLLVLFALSIGSSAAPPDRPVWRTERPATETIRRERTSPESTRARTSAEERRRTNELSDDAERRRLEDIRSARRITLRENGVAGDRMRDYIAGRLSENGFRVDKEVNIRTESGGVYRADIVARNTATGELLVIESKNTEEGGVDNFRGERGTQQRERIGEAARGRATFEVGSRRKPLETEIKNGDEVPRGSMKVVTPATVERVLDDIIRDRRQVLR